MENKNLKELAMKSIPTHKVKLVKINETIQEASSMEKDVWLWVDMHSEPSCNSGGNGYQDHLDDGDEAVYNRYICLNTGEEKTILGTGFEQTHFVLNNYNNGKLPYIKRK